MILKTKASQAEALAALEALLARQDLSTQQHKRISADLHAMKRGDRGERDCAFYLDPHIKNHPNRVIIHDLRLEHEGEVAQIDHLLINRGMHFHLLESKNFAHGLRINELGEFEYWNGKAYCGMASPIEQVLRQVRILERVVLGFDLLPKRLGITISPHFHHHVLVGPKSRVIRPPASSYDTSCVVKADAFITSYEEANANAGIGASLANLARWVSKETIIGIGQQLVAEHRAPELDLEARYGLEGDDRAMPQRATPATAAPGRQQPASNVPPAAVATAEAPSCPKCGTSMVERTARRGAKVGSRFWGCPGFPKCRGMIAIDGDA